VRIEESSFRYSTYRAWLAENEGAIADFRAMQRAAFLAERERWRAAGQDVAPAAFASRADESERPVVPEGCSALASPVAGSVWKVAAEVGAKVRSGDPVVVVEAMKTEIAVTATAGGTIHSLLVAPGAVVAPGQVVAIIRESAAGG
jgi:urea carboxylase